MAAPREEPWESRTPVRISDILGKWHLLPEYETDVAQARAHFLLLGKQPPDSVSEAERRACAFWMGLGYIDVKRQRDAVLIHRSGQTRSYVSSLLEKNGWDPATWKRRTKKRPSEAVPAS